MPTMDHTSGALQGLTLGVLVTVGTLLSAAAPTAMASSSDPACLPDLDPGRHALTLEVDGTPRDVIVQVPPSNAGVRSPAVVAFHGYTAHATQLEATSGLSALADERGFIVAYPEALGEPTSWHVAAIPGSGDRDIALTEAIVDALVSRACADPSRVFLAGHSMGGAMASDAACRLADRIAGAVLVSALWLEPPCLPARPVPVLSMHALDDPVLPYGGGPLPGFSPQGPVQLPVETAVGTWAQHDGCGPEPETAEAADGTAVLTWPDCEAPVVLRRSVSGGHDWPEDASPLIVDMIMGGD
jgi:polyhydroxybutyrate depolymerase